MCGNIAAANVWRNLAEHADVHTQTPAYEPGRAFLRGRHHRMWAASLLSVLERRRCVCACAPWFHTIVVALLLCLCFGISPSWISVSLLPTPPVYWVFPTCRLSCRLLWGAPVQCAASSVCAGVPHMFCCFSSIMLFSAITAIVLCLMEVYSFGFCCRPFSSMARRF
jgi:hypothetical protein